MRLSGKNVIITGGSRGIGRAAVELFAEEGGKVFNLDISLDEPFSNPNIEFIQHDVTDWDAWQRVTGEIHDTHGSIDILFNNAGSVGAYEGIEDIDINDWHRIVDLNLNGVFYGARAVIPYMKAQGGGVWCIRLLCGDMSAQLVLLPIRLRKVRLGHLAKTWH